MALDWQSAASRRARRPLARVGAALVALAGDFLDVSAFVALKMRAGGTAVSEADLDLKRVAAIDRGGPGRHGVEGGVDLFVQAFQEPLFADRENGTAARSGDRYRLDRPVAPVTASGQSAWDTQRPVKCPPASLTILRRLPSHAGEVVHEKLQEGATRGGAEHLDQLPYLDAARMRLDVHRVRAARS